jgi:hypothetical protein
VNERVGFSLPDGLALVDAPVLEVWYRYLGLGGAADAETLRARLVDGAPCDPLEHDLIAQALNECFLDRGMPTFPVSYSRAGSAADLSGPAGGLPDGAWTGAASLHRPTGHHAVPTSAANDRANALRRRTVQAARRATELQLASARLLEQLGYPAAALSARRRAQLTAARATLGS